MLSDYDPWAPYSWKLKGRHFWLVENIKAFAILNDQWSEHRSDGLGFENILQAVIYQLGDLVEEK